MIKTLKKVRCGSTLNMLMCEEGREEDDEDYEESGHYARGRRGGRMT